MELSALKIEELPQYTYDDYVKWDGKWEILKGIPFAMSPSPGKLHQDLSLAIAMQLKQLLTTCPKCKVYLPIDWKIDEHTVVQPDVLVVCGEDSDKNRVTIPPVMIFEILSPSTEKKDRGIKYRLYQESGVKYYIIVNPELKSAEVYRLKTDKAEYDDKDEFRDGKMGFDLDGCEIRFDFSQVFGLV